MHEVTNLRVTQLRIYRGDELPFERLCSAEVGTVVQKTFCFGPRKDAVTFASGPIPAMAFEQGRLESAERGSVRIPKLVFDPRRIILVVEGSSTDGDQAIESLCKEVASMKGGVDLSLIEPEVVFEETSCDVSLDVDVNKMWSAGMRRFVERGIVPPLSSRHAKAVVGVPKLELQILYHVTNPQLIASQITLSPSSLTIASKPGVPLEKNRFTISSPSRSEVHLKLISALEESLVGSA